MKKRVVIKVGSAVLTQSGRVAKDRLMNLVNLIAKLHNLDYEIILVSSGAVAAGYTQLKIDKSIVSNRQALASIGQPILLSLYQKKFSIHNIVVSQVLLTADDFDSRHRTNYAKDAIKVLLENRVIPIINENDVTATQELIFGDNDQLSSHVAHYFDASLLVILSDIEAYYTKDPNRYSDAKALKVVSTIDKSELNQKHSANSEFATGGIVTKLKAANFMLENSKEMFLASGFLLDDIENFLIKNIHKGGTLFSDKK